MKYTLLIFLFPICLQAQSVSVSPYSIPLWGKAMYMSEVSVSYKYFGVHYFHTIKNYPRILNGKWTKTQSTASFSITHYLIKDILKSGIMLSYKKFPITTGSHFNFWIDAGYTFSDFRISYVHISNGFGLLNKNNMGFDSVRVSYHF